MRKEKPYSEEAFNLVTETSDLALDANREDLEVRTTKTSYSGREQHRMEIAGAHVGHGRTAQQRIEPTGLNITHTTIYNETTGQVEETKGAAAEQTLTFAQTVSGTGTEPGSSKPRRVSQSTPKAIWAADTANSRIEEFSPEGTYLGKFGEAGTEPGKLKEPTGLPWTQKATCGSPTPATTVSKSTTRQKANISASSAQLERKRRGQSTGCDHVRLQRQPVGRRYGQQPRREIQR